MICEKCHEQGERSKIYIGEAYITAMFFRPYFDENGNLCDDDPNITTTEMECSNGHEFVRKERGVGLRPETWVEWPNV